MRFRFERVRVSSVSLTVCLLILMSWNMKWAATSQTRYVSVIDRVARPNYEASIAFASLALEIVVLIVIWTSYQKRMRWSWFVMTVFVCVYFVPVHLLDTFLDIRRVGWPYWTEVFRQASEGRQYAVGALGELTILAVMIIAILLPVGDFFGGTRFSPSGGNQSKPD